MKRRTKRILLIGGVAVAMVGATVVVLTTALARVLDPGHQCDTGFSMLSSCTYHWSSTTTTQGQPIFGTPAYPIGTILYAETTSWAVAGCPENYIAKRLLCAAASVATPAQAASDDAVTTLPVPKPWVVRTAKNSPFIKSLHVETPLDLAAVLGFYRVELTKRGWTENDGAVVEPDRAVIALTTSDGPALLRLIHQDGRTIADLSLRKPAAVEETDMPPNPGQAKLLFGNPTDDEAVITINDQIIRLAARAGRALTNDGRKSPDSLEIDLPPGKYKFTFKVASFAAQDREFEVGADETWGLLVGEAGVPLPAHLY